MHVIPASVQVPECTHVHPHLSHPTSKAKDKLSAMLESVKKKKTSCILNHVSGASSPRETTYANTSRDDVRDRPRDDVRDRPRDDVRDRPRDDVRDWPRGRLRGSEAARQLGCEAARLRGNEAASERASRRASVITMITVSPSVSR